MNKGVKIEPKATDKVVRKSNTQSTKKSAKAKAKARATANQIAMRYKTIMDAQKEMYLRALLNPKFACVNSLQVKLPAVTTAPTMTIHVKNTFTVSANDNGYLLMSWRPGMLDTTMKRAEWAHTWLYEEMHKPVDSDVNLRHPQELKVYPAPNDGWVVTMDYPNAECHANYSELTVNNIDDLDGETQSGFNMYLPYRPIQLPIEKYRLVSAQMDVNYTGPLIERAGTITSGMYSGNLAPIAWGWLKGAATYDGVWNDDGDLVPLARINTTFVNPEDTNDDTIMDASEEMAKFGQFDKILSLPYGQRQPVQGTHSFMYYPINPLQRQLLSTGTYGGIETTWKSIGFHHPVSEETTMISGWMSTNQDDQHLYAEVTSPDFPDHIILNSFTQHEGNNMMGNASWLIGMSGLHGTKNVTVTIYETFEVTTGDDLAMIATTDPHYKVVDDPAPYMIAAQQEGAKTIRQINKVIANNA